MDNFIGVFDNVLSSAECNNIINYYEDLKKLNLTVDYKNYASGRDTERKDETVFVFEPEVFGIRATHQMLESFIPKFWECYRIYTENYGILRSSKKHGMNYARVQKTLPGQGYHTWHYEDDSLDTCQRLVTFILYLNDIQEGGETEFLYLHKRVQAKAGRLVIWPAGFTHTHRGNQPLSGEKYILTGWLDLLE